MDAEDKLNILLKLGGGSLAPKKNKKKNKMFLEAAGALSSGDPDKFYTQASSFIKTDLLEELKAPMIDLWKS